MRRVTENWAENRLEIVLALMIGALAFLSVLL